MKTFKHIKPSRIAQIILIAIAILVVAMLTGCKQEEPQSQYVSIDGTVHTSRIVKQQYDKGLVMIFNARMDLAVAKDSITRFQRDTAVIGFTSRVNIFNIQQAMYGK